jgi:hypothetical protein
LGAARVRLHPNNYYIQRRQRLIEHLKVSEMVSNKGKRFSIINALALRYDQNKRKCQS